MITLIDRPFGSALALPDFDNTQALEQPYLDYVADIYNHGVDKADRTGTGTRSVFGRMMRFNTQRGIPLLTTKTVPAKTVFDELKWFLEGSTNNNRLREINQMHSDKDWSKRDTIWEEWADKETGELGPIYSDQWRNFRGQILQRNVNDSGEFTALMFDKFEEGMLAFPGYDSAIKYEGFDQIQEGINLLKNSPDSRRILVSAWNPTMLKNMALPPCHVLFQFYTRPASYQERRLSYDRRYPGLGADNEINHEYFDDLDIPRRVVDCMLYQRSANERLH